MKRLATLCAFLLPCIPASLAHAQETADTTGAWRYFPLEVGDVWEYDGLAGNERRTVTGDTLIEDVRFFRYVRQTISETGLPVGLPDVLYARFDTLSTEPRYWNGEEFPLYGIPWGFPLGAPFGSEPEYNICQTSVGGGYEQTIEIGGDTVVTSVKLVDTGNCEITSTFAAGVGFIRYVTLGEELTLRYAHVGGVEYGSPLSAEEEAGAVPTRLLEPFPNPARGSVTVLFVLETPEQVQLTVVDLLGREVAVLADGFRSVGPHDVFLDASRLSPGVYVLRLTTSAGTRTHKLTVVR